MKKRTLNKATSRTVYNRLNSWFDVATEKEIEEGKEWYKEAQEFCEYIASHYRINPFTVACVISALSPNNKWLRNMIDTVSVIEAFIRNEKADTVSVCTYGANKAKAFEILESNSNIEKISIKTWNFAHNVGLLSGKHVTVDKWMVRAALTFAKEGKRNTVESLTPNQYELIADCICKIATERNLKAYQVQAIIWVAIRNNWK